MRPEIKAGPIFLNERLDKGWFLGFLSFALAMPIKKTKNKIKSPVEYLLVIRFTVVPQGLCKGLRANILTDFNEILNSLIDKTFINLLWY